MLTKSQIQKICFQYNIAPAKFKGQNFLIDKNIVKKIIEVAELKKEDIILEVGPGLGVLTGELVKQVKKVVAVELDKKISEFLKIEFIGQKNLRIVTDDILKINPLDFDLKNFNYKVVANLPYNITSVFLRKFLEPENKPSEIIVMIQKEVGERILAKPGKMNLLAVAVQFYSEPKILFNVSHNSFWPKPKVDSAVIRIKLKKELPNIDIKHFFQIVKIGFSAKRKQLQNNLANGLGLKNAKIREILINLGLNEKIRAQDLAMEDWVKLAKLLDH